MKIRQQLTDSLQNAYNQVGYTPERTPAGLLGIEGGVRHHLITTTLTPQLSVLHCKGLVLLRQALLRLALGGGNSTPPLPEIPNFSSRLGSVGGGFTQNIPGMSNNC